MDRRQPKQKKTRIAAIAAAALACLLLLGICFLLDRSPLSRPQAKTAARPETLRISEAQNNNVSTLSTAGGAFPGWIELENSGPEPVPLANMILATDSNIKRMLVFPNMELAAGERLVIFADASNVLSAPDGLHAPFRLPSEGGNTLYLMRADQTVLDSVRLPCIDDDASWCRTGADTWETSWKPTPGGANVIEGYRPQAFAVLPGALAINEVMTANRNSFPDEDGDHPDYVEIVNISGADADIGGWYLSDDAGNLTKWKLPSATLPADGVICLHCSGKDRRDDLSHLHTSFRLPKTGVDILLTDPQGRVASLAEVPALETGQAYSLVNGHWTTDLPPTPFAQNSGAMIETLNALPSDRQAEGIYISELMALPVSGYDWLELHNAGSADADLGGFGLSDNTAKPRKWQFPQETVLPAGGYLGVLLTGDASADTRGYLNADFALSGDGGYSVSLSTPDGAILDSIFLPEQIEGVSYGRTASGVCSYFLEATPMAANSPQTARGRAPAPEYSVPGGVYQTGDSFAVELSAPEDFRIYYTLDYTDPTEASSLYTGTPIQVNGTTVIRTRVYRDGYLPSVMDTRSYLYDVNAWDKVPYVISLVSDPEGLFSDATGIMAEGPNATPTFPHGSYGRGANYWMDWERESHVEFFTPEAKTAVSQECGIKIHGRNSRAYVLKSLKVRARRKYGSPRFAYPIFSDLPFEDYDGFILRYSGQDYKSTFMRDAVLTSLAADTGVLYQEAEECLVYLNGEYYSAGYVRENISAFEICRHRGWEGMEDDLDIVKGQKTVLQGSNSSFAALCDYLSSHDNTTREAYDRIDAIVDIDNYIEFITLELVLATPDTINVKRYRNPKDDGKWRWVLYDVDRALRVDVDTFKLYEGGSSSVLFKAFMQNPLLRERFLAYFDKALATTLSSQNMLDKVEAQKNKLLPILPDYLANLGLTTSLYQSRYKGLVKVIGARPAQVLRRLQNYFGFSSEEMFRRFPNAVDAMNEYSRTH